ncbi:MAG: Gfo/Idh/MocA family oxidoreductase [Victivallales bacterium]
MNKKKVGIIGLGAISGMKWGEPTDACPYNHAGGIYKSQQVELAAAVDVSGEVVEKFKNKWGQYFPAARYYLRLEDMLRDQELDIISICVKAPLHYGVVEQVIKAKPRAVFLEKPPTCSLNEMDRMVGQSKEAHVPITVSYSRHWSPKVLTMERLIKNGLIGEVQSVVSYCGGQVRGGTVLSFASHATDVICQFAGYDPVAVFAQGESGTITKDGYEPEPFLSNMTIEFPNGVQGVQIGHNGEFGGFYCEIFGSKGRARAGIYTSPYACDSAGKPIDLSVHGFTEERSPFAIAYDQIAQSIDGVGIPGCTGDEFVAVNEIGFGAIESMRSNQCVTLPNVNRDRMIYAIV